MLHFYSEQGQEEKGKAVHKIAQPAVQVFGGWFEGIWKDF